MLLLPCREGDSIWADCVAVVRFPGIGRTTLCCAKKKLINDTTIRYNDITYFG